MIQEDPNHYYSGGEGRRFYANALWKLNMDPMCWPFISGCRHPSLLSPASIYLYSQFSLLLNLSYLLSPVYTPSYFSYIFSSYFHFSRICTTYISIFSLHGFKMESRSEFILHHNIYLLFVPTCKD